MRYYYYGRTGEQTEAKQDRQPVRYRTGLSQQEIDRQMEGEEELIIDENTVYEIDRECIRCRRKADQ